MRDDLTKIAEVQAVHYETMKTLATKEEVAEVKADVKTIKAAVQATNQDLQVTQKLFKRFKPA